MIDGETSKIIVEADAGLVAPSEDSESLVSNILILSQYTSDQISELENNAYRYYQNHFNREDLFNYAEDIFVDLISKNNL